MLGAPFTVGTRRAAGVELALLGCVNSSSRRSRLQSVHRWSILCPRNRADAPPISCALRMGKNRNNRADSPRQFQNRTGKVAACHKRPAGTTR